MREPPSARLMEIVIALPLLPGLRVLDIGCGPGAMIREGRMQSAEQAEIDRAKADGRWDAAYDSPANAKKPETRAKRLATFVEMLCSATRGTTAASSRGHFQNRRQAS